VINNVDYVLLISRSRYVRLTGRGRGPCETHCSEAFKRFGPVSLSVRHGNTWDVEIPNISLRFQFAILL